MRHFDSVRWARPPASREATSTCPQVRCPNGRTCVRPRPCRRRPRGRRRVPPSPGPPQQTTLFLSASPPLGSRDRPPRCSKPALYWRSRRNSPLGVHRGKPAGALVPPRRSKHRGQKAAPVGLASPRPRPYRELDDRGCVKGTGGGEARRWVSGKLDRAGRARGRDRSRRSASRRSTTHLDLVGLAAGTGAAAVASEGAAASSCSAQWASFERPALVELAVRDVALPLETGTHVEYIAAFVGAFRPSCCALHLAQRYAGLPTQSARLAASTE